MLTNVEAPEIARMEAHKSVNTKARTVAGVILTALWVAMWGWIAIGRGEAVSEMRLNELGDFFAGAVAPVAFLWLILGYFQQGDELAQNTEALRAQVQETEALVQAYAQQASASVKFTEATIAEHERQAVHQASRVYLELAVRLLESAFETFTRDGATPPKNDRLTWLSTARMLARFQEMQAQVISPECKTLLAEHEELWRRRFHVLLRDNNKAFTPKYFKPDGALYGGNTIYRKSIAVIFAFAGWKEGTRDPLESIDDKELLARGAVPIDFFGVEEFLEEYVEYWAAVQARKKQLAAEGEREGEV